MSMLTYSDINNRLDKSGITLNSKTYYYVIDFAWFKSLAKYKKLMDLYM